MMISSEFSPLINQRLNIPTLLFNSGFIFMLDQQKNVAAKHSNTVEPINAVIISMISYASNTGNNDPVQ